MWGAPPDVVAHRHSNSKREVDRRRVHVSTGESAEVADGCNGITKETTQQQAANSLGVGGGGIGRQTSVVVVTGAKVTKFVANLAIIRSVVESGILVRSTVDVSICSGGNSSLIPRCLFKISIQVNRKGTNTVKCIYVENLTTWSINVE